MKITSIRKIIYVMITAILSMVLFIGVIPSVDVFASSHGDGGTGIDIEDHAAYDAPTSAITVTVSRWKDRPFSYSKSSEKARVRFYDETGTALTPFYYSTEGITKERFDAEDNGAALVSELGGIVTVTGGQTLNAYLNTGEKVYYVLQRRYHLEMAQEARYVYFVNDTTRFIDITEGPVKSENGHDIYTLHANDSDHTKLGEVYLVGTSVYDAKTDEREGSTGSTGKWQFRSTMSTNTYGLGFGGNGPSLPAGCDMFRDNPDGPNNLVFLEKKNIVAKAVSKGNLRISSAEDAYLTIVNENTETPIGLSVKTGGGIEASADAWGVLEKSMIEKPAGEDTDEDDDSDTDEHVHIFRNVENSCVCSDCGKSYIYYTCEKCDCGEKKNVQEFEHTCPPNKIVYIASGCSCGGAAYGGRVSISDEMVYSPADIKSLGKGSIYFPGHEFFCWNTKSDGSGTDYYPGDYIPFEHERGESINLYARWTAVPVTLYLERNTDGLCFLDRISTSPLQPIQMLYDEKFEDLPNIEAYGYDLVGWKTIDGTKIITTSDRFSDVFHEKEVGTLAAVWEAKRNPVKIHVDAPSALNSLMNDLYDYDSGAYGKDLTVRYGDNFGTILSNPVGFGYDFIGYYDNRSFSGEVYTENRVVDTVGNIELWGKWEPHAYVYTFNLDRAEAPEGETEVTSGYFRRTYAYDRPYTDIPVLNKEGYTFERWFLEPNGRGKKIENGVINTIAKNVMVYPYFKPIEYTINFDYSESFKWDFDPNISGSEEKTRKVFFKTAYALPEPVRYGYYFLGWSTQITYDYETIDETGKVVVRTADYPNGDKDYIILQDGEWNIAEDVSLYAVWKEESVGVLYDYNYEYTTRVPLEDTGDWRQ